MKNKTATTLTVLILLMGISLAYYPGETISFENTFGTENLVYTIINNVSAVEDFEVEVNSTNITITFPQDMPPNSFDIVFFEPEIEEVIVTVSSGGSGGGGTKYIYKNNTIYKDRDIETIKTEYVDREVTVDEPAVEDAQEQTDDDGGLLTLFLVFLVVLILIGLILWLRFRNKEEGYEAMPSNIAYG